MPARNRVPRDHVAVRARACEQTARSIRSQYLYCGIDLQRCCAHHPKLSLPWLTLRGVGLASKYVAG